MSASQPIFDSYSRPQSLDFSDSLLAFPSCGTLIARFKTALGNWAQTSIQNQADTALWDNPSVDARIQTEMVRAFERPAHVLAAPFDEPSSASDQHPLNDGWAQIIEHAYQTRFHSNGARHA
ncbi:hypothetical protein [Hydrogenophaga crassostreae]|nr:hypothetical protein [Hydrogenophaga crassostreae]